MPGIIDITNKYANANTVCNIEIEKSLYSSCASGYTQFYVDNGYAPILEIEYITNEDIKPTKKSFSLAGIANGELDVKTGELVTDFCDVTGDDSVLGVSISHVYKKSSADFNVGSNFHLNLHEKFEKKTNEAMDANYIYTDATGVKHAFKDLYYYLDGQNKKIYVDKSTVNVDLDGQLFYEESKTTYNFEVEDFHTYYVGDGVLVHNIDCSIKKSSQNHHAISNKINKARQIKKLLEN